ncbi:MAG: tripartite tricarboxylate transporter substrate binding protein [Burkholderiales bacterium]|nr:tripartite tricarboxylate transporter substrate binding protein [Burkholderiales bacterium]
MMPSTPPARSSRLARLARAACAACLAALPLAALAQGDYPARAVRIVVPFPPGGLADSLARLFGRELQERLGQPFPVESRPGAATNIGAAHVAQSAPDGYTLLVTTIATNALNKWSYRNLSFDPHGFAEIGMLGVNTLYVMVAAQSPHRSVADLIRSARESTTGLAYGSYGNGGPNHLIAEVFRRAAGIGRLLHVPYKGASDASVDLIGGRIDFMIDGATINLVNSGKLRALAVAYPRRWPTQPDVPTMAELGYPEVTITTYFGLAAPPNTPPAILDRLNQAVRVIGSDAEIGRRLLGLNVMAMPVGRQEAAAFMREQSERWGPVLRSLNITLD